MATALNNHQRSASSASASLASRRGLSSPPSMLSARLFAKLSGNFSSSQPSIEQKMAELRAAYASPPMPIPSTRNNSLAPNAVRRNGPTRASLPTPSLSDMLETQFGYSRSFAPTRRASVVASCVRAPSLMDLASTAGLLSLSPSDLVFESSVLGIAYYDFVLSVSEVPPQSAVDDCDIARLRRRDSQSQHVSPARRRLHCTGSDPTQPAPPAPSASSSTSTLRKAVAMLDKLSENAKKRPKNTGADAISNERSSLTVTIEHASAEEEDDDIVPENVVKEDDAETNKTLYRLFLAKFDAHTNVEWFESVVVPAELLERNGIPVSELSLLTMGILVWRGTLNNARLLCLANGQLNAGDDNTAALEALKRAACKYKCMHHVLTIGQRRQSAASTHSSCSSTSYRSSSSSGSHGQNQQDPGMKLRVLMCQSRNELSEVPSQAVRDTKFLLAPSSNPLLCLCFPLT